MIPAAALAALGRLNGHARANPSYGVRRAIYAYKTAAAAELVRTGAASIRLVRWTGKCNRCSNGRFQHWDWDDGHTVACRDCAGSGIRTLRFTETTLPDGQVWHQPWFVGDGRGFDIARLGTPGLQMEEGGTYRDGAGNPLPWHDTGEWAPNSPGQELALADLAPLLNTVEDWVEGLTRGDWLVQGAKRYLCCHRYRRVIASEPEHAYKIDLGRAPGGCFVCGSEDLAGFAYGRYSPLFHWSLPVCERHGRGPVKAPHPRDGPPEALLTEDIRRWIARHERVEVLS